MPDVPAIRTTVAAIGAQIAPVLPDIAAVATGFGRFALAEILPHVAAVLPDVTAVGAGVAAIAPQVPAVVPHLATVSSAVAAGGSLRRGERGKAEGEHQRGEQGGTASHNESR